MFNWTFLTVGPFVSIVRRVKHMSRIDQTFRWLKVTIISILLTYFQPCREKIHFI